ncbi:MAG: hypothetical protein R3Y56_00585 [Akkermansia sp.]
MHQALTERKRQALMRIASSRVKTLTAVEDTTKLVQSWRASMPNANTMGKLSLGLGASWLVGKGVQYYMLKRSGGAVALPTKKTIEPSKSILRYLALQACTLVVLPFVRHKIAESGASDFAKSFSKTSMDQLFYRWLGLEH